MNETQEQFDWHNTEGYKSVPEEPRYADEDVTMNLQDICDIFTGFNTQTKFNIRRREKLQQQIKTQHNLLEDQRDTARTLISQVAGYQNSIKAIYPKLSQKAKKLFREHFPELVN